MHEIVERYKNGERDFSGLDLNEANLHKAILSEVNLVMAGLNWANLSMANLSGANLSGAELCGANLRMADLDWVNLSMAKLIGANLSGANLNGTNLHGVDLSLANLSMAKLIGSDLSGADLSGANLYGANLCGASLHRASLPAPTTVLLADWGEVSDELCVDLMRFDAWFHDKPTMFNEWALSRGPCPYEDKSFQRACNFRERRKLYSPGRPPKGFNLMVRLIKEKCANSDWHEKEAKNA